MTDVNLRDTEWDILEALWALEAATAREVCDHLQPRRGWAYSTVKTMLDRLVKRGVVAQEREGRSWCYRAVIGRAEAQRSVWRRFVELAFGGSSRPALRFVSQESDLTEAQRAELLELLGTDEP